MLVFTGQVAKIAQTVIQKKQVMLLIKKLEITFLLMQTILTVRWIFISALKTRGGASGFIATAVYKGGSCTLTVNDTNVVDDSSC